MALALVVVTAACGAAESSPDREVTVLAAASLTDAVREVARVFEDAHPGTDVRLNLAGSQQLAAQLVQGARADVFASADHVQMRMVREEGLLAGPPEVFARNRLAIAVQEGNPLRIAGLGGLAVDGRRVVLAAEQVPAGRYARRALSSAGVTVRPVSLELDVRAVLAKVALGEADAGIVYASDLEAFGDRVDEVRVRVRHGAVARYPVAVLEGAAQPDAARAFVDLLRSAQGRAILRRHGFSVP